MWASCHGKGLAGETCFAHLLSIVSVFGVALIVLCLRLLSSSPPLPCYVRPWRVGLTARAQVKGYKGVPLLLYTDTMRLRAMFPFQLTCRNFRSTSYGSSC